MDSNAKTKKEKVPREKCTTCKKKNKITTLPAPVDELYIPDINEIKTAYFNLISMGGVKNEDKAQIDKVYEFLFQQKFDWGCRDCVSSQVIKFTNHMRYVLKAIR